MSNTISQPPDNLSSAESSESFSTINNGFNAVFRPQRLSLGLVVPIESYPHSAEPALAAHLERVQLAESLGFSAVWLRDLPFNVPSFGDAGQLHDPFVYLGYLAGQTTDIALGVASLILPLRHPAHVAKAAASVDVLSGGRLLLGVASGDRPQEYPALNINFDDRGALFRESMAYIRQMADNRPVYENALGRVDGGMDLLPKPATGRLPLLITGGSQQDPVWVAEHGDGWMTYPRDALQQARVIRDYRNRVAVKQDTSKPVMQPLYVDLEDDPDCPPQPIHLGMRVGARPLGAYLKSLESIGVNHVALNLRFNQSPIEKTLQQLADELLPHFS